MVDEAAELLLIVSEEFEDGKQMLEVQKIHPSKNNYEEFHVNFTEEPNKS